MLMVYAPIGEESVSNEGGGEGPPGQAPLLVAVTLEQGGGPAGRGLYRLSVAACPAPATQVAGEQCGVVDRAPPPAGNPW